MFVAAAGFFLVPPFLPVRSLTMMYSIIVYMMFEFAHWIGSIFANIVSGYCFIVRICVWEMWMDLIGNRFAQYIILRAHSSHPHTHTQKKWNNKNNLRCQCYIIGRIEKGFCVNVRLKIAWFANGERNTIFSVIFCTSVPECGCAGVQLHLELVRLVQYSIVFAEIEHVLKLSIYS